MSPRFMPRALLLAWIAGYALGASGPPHHAWAPAFLFGAALRLATTPLIDSRRIGRAALVGLASGIGFGCSALVWIAPAVLRFVPGYGLLAWPATVAAIVLSALAPALGTALYVASARARDDGLRLATSVALGFSAVPMLFPYRPIAMALPLAPAAAWLSIGGAVLGDLLVLLPGCMVVAAWTRRDAALAWRAAGLLAVALCLGQAETLRAEHVRASAPEVRLGVVQSNVGILEGRERERRQARLERLRAHTHVLAEQSVEAVLWPESSYPFALDRLGLQELAAPRDVGAASAGVRVVVGAGTVSGPCAHWNSIVAFDAEGRRLGLVDKERRMPFADASLSSLLFRPDESRCGELSPAREVALLPGTHGAGAMVCYDEVEPWVARERALAGAGYLVGFTNDAWYAGTRQPSLHERVARMRAIETGRDLIRVVNGGPSSLIASSGRVVARIPEGREAARVFTVRPQSDRTLATILGGALEWLMLGVLLASAQWRRTSSSGGGR